MLLHRYLRLLEDVRIGIDVKAFLLYGALARLVQGCFAYALLRLRVQSASFLALFKLEFDDGQAAVDLRRSVRQLWLDCPVADRLSVVLARRVN